MIRLHPDLKSSDHEINYWDHPKTWQETRDWLHAPEHLAFVYGDGNPHKDNCGHCKYGRIADEEERKMYDSLAAEPTADDYKRKSDAIDRRWRKTKYIKFYQECIAGGLDWKAEFAARGWEA